MVKEKLSLILLVHNKEDFIGSAFSHVSLFWSDKMIPYCVLSDLVHGANCPVWLKKLEITRLWLEIRGPGFKSRFGPLNFLS
jgi:valyl-tRNA synthetase